MTSSFSNKTRKRIMKLKGACNYAFSCALLRYTSLQRKTLLQQISRHNINRLHIGCGDVHLPGWLNIFLDKRKEYGRLKKENGCWTLNYDLMKPWPVEDNSISFVAGSHFIEHFDLNAGFRLASEAFRVLKKGGVLRLSCPDLEIYAKNYIQGNKDFFDHKLIREWCTFKAAQTPGEIFIAKAYDSGGAHRWFYDFASLKHVLEKAGFKDIKKIERLTGLTPDLKELEPPLRELETLYVEGTK